MTNIGTLGGQYSSANDINDSGMIGGSATDASNHSYAYIHQNGSMSSLGSIGSRNSGGSSINNSGVVVSTLSNRPGDGLFREGVIFENGSVTSLGHSSSIDHAGHINDNGQIQATFDFSGVFGGKSTSGRKSYLYHAGQIVDANIADYTGRYLIGQDLNNNGNLTGIVASVSELEDRHAFAYIDDILTDLGTLGGIHSFGYAINDLDQIVGKSLLSNSEQHAFLWDSINGMVDLNTLIDPSSGWVLQQSTDINNHGDIVGYGTINGETHAFLLQAVPEPNVLALILFGGLVFSLARIKQDNTH